ncbi:hypothetical protein SAMN06265222_10997 [Neorhodopirellula lusitana]|uniref:Uncharacterized protein n=1 Tax=Neorhodopirellula lusitana TaxID=445327 RepID=A0ABY1QBG7_9BACT|nr:hypothetical protein [Neorhodopirellula lusitana]SMP65572.1 hypothetical protein SAMN06265222_10997 [Neorhodopirellula lusitana]
MQNDPIKRLPTRHEVGAAIIEATDRARRLRSLYRLVCQLDRDQERHASDQSTATDEPSGGEHE